MKTKEIVTQKIVLEVHQLFDSNKLWEILENSEKVNKDVIRVFMKAVKLIRLKTKEWNKDKDDYSLHIDSTRLFYDSLYGYISGTHEVNNYCLGGLLLATLSAFSIFVELGSQLEMYFDDDEIPFLNGSNKYLLKVIK